MTSLTADFKAAFGTEPLTAQSWGSVPFSSIDPATDTPQYIYQTSKTAAERELWAIAMSNPTVDFTTIAPPVIFGPFVPHFPNSTDRMALGTNDFVYSLLTGGPDGPNTYAPIPIGHMVDVRDVAKAHVQALSASRMAGTNKRLLICSGTFKWKATADLIRTARPELASRLPAESEQAVMQTNAPMDVSLAAKVIGMSEDGYIRWEETMLASIDAVVAWEKTVKA
jgi:nucleoside-diphosphate-sugar epimerase